MKKFMKICAITALIMCVLGIVLASLAGSIKGREAINEVVENVTDGKVNVKLNGWSDWGVTIADELRDNIGNANYVIEDAISFSKKYIPLIVLLIVGSVCLIIQKLHCL